MPLIEAAKMANPAERFRMARVAALSLGQDVPQPMELAMLSKEVMIAKLTTGNVPDSHAR